MRYIKKFNKFNEAVAIGVSGRHIIDGDNFDLSKNLKFPEVEDLDMYLQLIEDDGYEYDIEEFIVKDSSNKFEYGVDDICDYKFIKVISIELPTLYDLNEIDFLQEFKRKYFKSDKYDMRLDVIESDLRILKIKIIPKEIIDVKNIVKKFNDDVEKFLNDNKDILTGNIEIIDLCTRNYSFGFSTVINNCSVLNINTLKDKLNEFLKSYDYYIGVVLSRNRRMTFTLSIDLIESEID